MSLDHSVQVVGWFMKNKVKYHLDHIFLSGLPSKSFLADAASLDEGKRLRYQMSNLTAYERHKLLINHYVLYHPGSTAVLQRDAWVMSIRKIIILKYQYIVPMFCAQFYHCIILIIFPQKGHKPVIFVLHVLYFIILFNNVIVWSSSLFFFLIILQNNWL